MILCLVFDRIVFCLNFTFILPSVEDKIGPFNWHKTCSALNKKRNSQECTSIICYLHCTCDRKLCAVGKISIEVPTLQLIRNSFEIRSINTKIVWVWKRISGRFNTQCIIKTQIYTKYHMSVARILRIDFVSKWFSNSFRCIRLKSLCIYLICTLLLFVVSFTAHCLN